MFATGDDPVKLGLVASLNKPGGNATGVTDFVISLLPKRLQVLRELVPNGGASHPPKSTRPFQCSRNGVLVVNASTEEQVDKAFATMSERQVAAILYGATLFFQVVGDRLVALAARFRIPALYEWREFVTAGGLMSYSTDRAEFARQAGTYAGRILKGEKPADLPVLQSSRFEFVINLRTAKALGLAIPSTMLARADEVIE